MLESDRLKTISISREPFQYRYELMEYHVMHLVAMQTVKAEYKVDYSFRQNPKQLFHQTNQGLIEFYLLT